MRKAELREKVKTTQAETAEALQTMYDAMDDKQREKIEKDERVNKKLKHHKVKKNRGER